MPGKSHTFHTAREVVAWLHARVSAGAQMTVDSRKLQPGDVFVAMPGYAKDGRSFVAASLHQGAAACVVEAEGAEPFAFDECVACVPQLKTLAGEIAAEFYQHPSKQLEVIAVTGTNGKTTVTNWIAQSLEKLHIPCAVIGTLGLIYAGNQYDTSMTTPDPITLQRYLRHVVDQGCKAVAMEASSHGIEESRLNGVEFQCAVFTNLTQDHLDYHGDMWRYAAAKRKLFDRKLWPNLKRAVLNADDATGAKWLDELSRDGAIEVIGYGIEQPANWRADKLMPSESGITFTVTHQQRHHALSTQFIGKHNVENFLATLAVVSHYAPTIDSAVRVCASVISVSGRLEIIYAQGAPLAVVDYAHTPDALEKALQALKPTAEKRKGALWAVFGCGGDRDKTKRPLMARAAERGADHVVVTSDNPRTENAQSILNEITLGLSKPAQLIELDRRKAIRNSIGLAKQQDVVLIAGKGHEDYQIIGTVKHPFSDQAEARAAQQSYLSLGAQA